MRMIDRFLFWLKTHCHPKTQPKIYISNHFYQPCASCCAKNQSKAIQFVELREIKCQISYVFTKLSFYLFMIYLFEQGAKGKA